MKYVLYWYRLNVIVMFACCPVGLWIYNSVIYAANGLEICLLQASQPILAHVSAPFLLVLLVYHFLPYACSKVVMKDLNSFIVALF